MIFQKISIREKFDLLFFSSTFALFGLLKIFEMNALTFSLLMKLKLDRSMSDWKRIIAFEGRLIPISGILFKICNVLSKPQTFFSETPRKSDRKRFIETAEVTVDTEVSAAEFNF